MENLRKENRMQLPKLKRYQKKYDFSYAFGAYPVLDLLKYQKEILKTLMALDFLNN